MIRYYKKGNAINKRRIVRFIALGIFSIGFIISLVIFSPVISGLIFANSAQEMAMPIPSRMMVTQATIESFISQSVNSVTGFNSTDASQWFPNIKEGKPTAPVTAYNLSIPKLGIIDAEVTTIDNELEKHLVNYGGTAIPPNKGTAAVFGHSTLPWLFNPKNYKTIFATLETSLKVGDIITVKVNGVIYTYRVYEMVVVNADDAEILQQNYNDSYLFLITCSPPGTTWRRLIVKSRLVKDISSEN